MMFDAAIVQRFWNKVDQTSEDQCWPWTAARNSDGYGVFRVGDRFQRAHRVSYELCEGPIPPGLIVRHSCHNPACVNPDHLQTGTQKDNMQDMLQAGREARGTAAGGKFTEQQICDIRNSGRRDYTRLAAELNVNPSAVRRIILKETYRWVQ